MPNRLSLFEKSYGPILSRISQATMWHKGKAQVVKTKHLSSNLLFACFNTMGNSLNVSGALVTSPAKGQK